MNYITSAIAALAIAATAAGCATSSHETPDSDPARFVDPLIGTDYTGNTYPGAQVPFGMVQLSPDNGLPGWDRIAGYFYPDSTIAGFSHTHLSGTGAGDLYDISFMPVTFPMSVAPEPLGVHSRFSHSTETVSAGYYKVTLDDYGIDVELTASERCGMQRYAFPPGHAAVILNLDKAMNWDATTDSRIEAVNATTIAGYRFSDGWARDQQLWFASRFSQPWDSLAVVSRPIGADGRQGLVATFHFTISADAPTLTVATALSCTGQEGAIANLAAEMPDDDFDRYAARARRMWNEALLPVTVEELRADADTTDLVNFYTALYHSMLAPTIYGDADGRYRGPDKAVHQANGWTNYGTFSLWDTYRAAHPLYTLIAPRRAQDMAVALLEFARQNGRLPVWNFQGSETDMMIGYHSAPVIVDAYFKGLLPDSLAEAALEACVHTATLDDYREIGLYRSLGYVPSDAPGYKPTDDNWSMSKTLEYAYDDHCIALLAKALGRDSIAAVFTRRAQNFRNTFNPATRFFQPRDSKGNFDPAFRPEDYSKSICESNAWHYLWSVQHDIPALIELVGGREAFAERLRQMMTASADTSVLPIFSTGMIGQYAHGNEPSHHVIYLHNDVGRHDLTARYVAEVTDRFYRSEPAGLCGNEDCGQMSAWFVFSALGFYPVDPTAGVYYIGTPLFARATLHLDGGRTFTIEAPGLRKGHPRVDRVLLNGRPLDTLTITHRQILDGGTLTFEMSPD